MAKWKTVRVKQELLAAAESAIETGQYKSLSEFVSEAIQLRLKQVDQSHRSTATEHTEYPVVEERLLCSPQHMWAMVTPEGNIKIGLSDYAQRHLKGVSTIQTQPIGYEVSKGDPLGSVETWMFQFTLHAPVSGKIVKVNRQLLDRPQAFNEDPYETGWIAEIKPTNTVTLEEELRDLMSPKQYKLWAIKQRQFAHTKS